MKNNTDLHFFWRKLHSLMGIIPLGIFLAFHLFINSFALKGEDAFDAAAGTMVKLPYLLVIEIVVIFIPLLFHTIYGIAILWSSDPDLQRYPKYSNWMYFLQRVTGIIAVIFVVAHVYGTTISIRFINHQEVSFTFMSFLLSNPLTFLFYVIGMGSVVYHFANGLWNFMITWGITAGRNAQRIMGYVCVLIGLALFAVGVNALAGFIGKGITIFNG